MLTGRRWPAIRVCHLPCGCFHLTSPLSFQHRSFFLFNLVFKKRCHAAESPKKHKMATVQVEEVPLPPLGYSHSADSSSSEEEQKGRSIPELRVAVIGDSSHLLMHKLEFDVLPQFVPKLFGVTRVQFEHQLADKEVAVEVCDMSSLISRPPSKWPAFFLRWLRSAHLVLLLCPLSDPESIASLLCHNKDQLKILLDDGVEPASPQNLAESLGAERRTMHVKGQTRTSLRDALSSLVQHPTPKKKTIPSSSSSSSPPPPPLAPSSCVIL